MHANNIKNIAITLTCLILIFFMPYVIPGIVISSQEIEEDAEMTMPFDNVVIGDMDNYFRDLIIVDDVRYGFCAKFNIFSPTNSLMALKDIGPAEKVKLFINGGCVRKVKVLRFAS